jgi:hypothetical protein
VVPASTVTPAPAVSRVVHEPPAAPDYEDFSDDDEPHRTPGAGQSYSQ